MVGDSEERTTFHKCIVKHSYFNFSSNIPVAVQEIYVPPPRIELPYGKGRSETPTSS